MPQQVLKRNYKKTQDLDLLISGFLFLTFFLCGLPFSSLLVMNQFVNGGEETELSMDPLVFFFISITTVFFAGIYFGYSIYKSRSKTNFKTTQINSKQITVENKSISYLGGVKARAFALYLHNGDNILYFLHSGAMKYFVDRTMYQTISVGDSLNIKYINNDYVVEVEILAKSSNTMSTNELKHEELSEYRTQSFKLLIPTFIIIAVCFCMFTILAFAIAALNNN